MSHNIMFAGASIISTQMQMHKNDEEDKEKEEIKKMMETMPAWKILAIWAITILFFIGISFLTAFLLLQIIHISISFCR